MGTVMSGWMDEQNATEIQHRRRPLVLGLFLFSVLAVRSCSRPVRPETDK